MVVTLGYKQTEVGVIPDEWCVLAVGDIVDATAPICYGVVQVGRFVDVGIPIVAIKYVKDISHAPLHRASPDIEKSYARSRVKGGDVLISIKGTIGRVGVVPAEFYGNISRDLARLRLKEEYDPHYIAYQLQSDRTQARISRAVVGTTRLELSIATLRQFQVPVPTVPEQHAITAALSDVDALLGGLDRLIGKKRDLKLAAMQQLLTAQTRLPGFHGGWKVQPLGEILDICHGKSQRDVEVTDGPYPILATGGQIGTSSRALYDKPSVLIGRKGTIDQPQYMDTPFWTVDTLFYSIIKDDNSARFLYYRFCLIDWLQLNEASGVPSLNAGTIEKVEIKCPEPAEQAAIAAVLSDMDAELASLQARRDKTRGLKQGMMQELLTGKTRLALPAESHA